MYWEWGFAWHTAGRFQTGTSRESDIGEYAQNSCMALSLDKMLTTLNSTTCEKSSASHSANNSCHVWNCAALGRRPCSLVSLAAEIAD